MKRAFKRTIITLFILLGVLDPGPPRAASGAVDLALVLAIDCSDSVDDGEYRLQIQGLAGAFQNQEVIDALSHGPLGQIEVAVLEWSGARSQRVVVTWMLVDGKATAAALAARILSAPRLPPSGGTSLSGAVDAGVATLLAAPLAADRQVIDVSSDGINNTGDPPELARNDAVSLGITVNALAILTEVPYLKAYFERKLIGGSGSFALPADDYLAYHDAILKKLLREIVRPVS